MSGPFVETSSVCTSSTKTDVKLYPNGLVVKYPKPDSKRIVTMELAFDEIQRMSAWSSYFNGIIEKQGGGEGVLVRENAVIVGSGSSDIEIARYQKFVDGTELGSVGLNILNLSTESLIDLRSIYLANIEAWIKTGIAADVIGSKKDSDFGIRCLRHIFPLMSVNILIDNNGNPRFIDVGRADFSESSTQTKLLRIVALGNSALSIFVINLMLGIREMVKFENGQTSDFGWE